MITSATFSLNENYDGKEPIPARKLAYFRERQRNRLFDFLVGRFLEKERSGELTRAELARRMNRSPEQITRWFAAPGNWTLDTISDFSLAICDGEITFSIAPIAKAQRNCNPLDLLPPPVIKATAPTGRLKWEWARV